RRRERRRADEPPEARGGEGEPQEGRRARHHRDVGQPGRGPLHRAAAALARLNRRPTWAIMGAHYRRPSSLGVFLVCGIACLLHCGDRESLARMTGIQSHRGPDDAGLEWFSATRSGLGHRRLSIIDLSPAGHQPMPNDDGTLWITFNGEVYNYQDVRRELAARGYRFRSGGETEVILKAYQEWGPSCLDRLNGMFAFAVYDASRDELFAARDRLGIKPFYYHHDGERFAFASEIKALLVSGQVEARPDLVALHTPARFQVSPRTGVEGVFKLP